MGIKRIEIVRRNHGMTKADVAKASGIAPTMYGWIESGRYKPYEIQLNRIADVLGVDDAESLLDEIEA